VLITYIVKSTKNQKGQTPENGFALLKNDITTFEPTSKLGIHSSYVVCLIMLLEFNSIHIVLFILFPENIKNPYNSFNSL
jgi:hypothetical protein